MSYSVFIPQENVFTHWRAAARIALSHSIPPAEIFWRTEHSAADFLIEENLPNISGPRSDVKVSSAYLDLAKSVLFHRDDRKFSMLYQGLWRLSTGDRTVLSPVDPLGRKLSLMRKSVGRDIHKFHAFLRFHELPSEGKRRCFGAWFEPEHFTLEPAAAFFAKRFADMDWVISTPDLTARFTAGKLSFGPANIRAPDFPLDEAQSLWLTYFANIFNPARVKTQAMLSEMPKKYWKNLPETDLIPAMLQEAEERVGRMLAAGASKPNPTAEKISPRARADLARKRGV